MANADVGGDEPRMKCVDRDSVTCQAAGQLVGEQQIGELGTLVGQPSVVAALALQVIEVQSYTAMRFGRDVDDARRRRRPQRRQQQMSEEEVVEVVECERHLDRIGGQAAPAKQSTGVVDQHVEL